MSGPTRERQGLLVYWGLRAGIALARWLPEPIADRLCRAAGVVAYLLAAQARGNVLANLSHVLPAADEAELRRTARRVFYSVARSYYELVRAPWLTPAELERRVRVEGWERLTTALASGQGVIVLASHLGDFNTMPQYGAVRGVPVTTAMEQLRPDALYELVHWLRTRHGAAIAPAGREGLRELLATLRRGAALVLVADRDVTGSGVATPFFDWPARLPIGPATLALRTGATLLPMYTYREGRDRSALVVQEPVEPIRTGDHETDVLATTAAIAEALEIGIRAHPDQWVVLQAIWEDAEPHPGLRWPRGGAAPE